MYIIFECRRGPLCIRKDCRATHPLGRFADNTCDEVWEGSGPVPSFLDSEDDQKLDEVQDYETKSKNLSSRTPENMSKPEKAPTFITKSGCKVRLTLKSESNVNKESKLEKEVVNSTNTVHIDLSPLTLEQKHFVSNYSSLSNERESRPKVMSKPPRIPGSSQHARSMSRENSLSPLNHRNSSRSRMSSPLRTPHTKHSRKKSRSPTIKRNSPSPSRTTINPNFRSSSRRSYNRGGRSNTYCSLSPRRGYDKRPKFFDSANNRNNSFPSKNQNKFSSKTHQPPNHHPPPPQNGL